MARFARIVVPGIPHHVTQRGNRREPIFFENGDHDVYCDMLAEQTHRHGVEVLSLLPDAQPRPPYPDPLDRRGARPCHGRGASTLHQLRQRAGALERPPVPGTLCLGSMDEAHLIAAVRYVSLNPVRARLVCRAEDWAWSSVRAHLSGEDDGLVRARPVLDRVERFGQLIADGEEAERRYDGALHALRSSETTGRPLGPTDFVEDLERRLGRRLARGGRGRKPQTEPEKQASLF
jgi:putative transposase